MYCSVLETLIASKIQFLLQKQYNPQHFTAQEWSLLCKQICQNWPQLTAVGREWLKINIRWLELNQGGKLRVSRTHWSQTFWVRMIQCQLSPLDLTHHSTSSSLYAVLLAWGSILFHFLSTVSLPKIERRSQVAKWSDRLEPCFYMSCSSGRKKEAYLLQYRNKVWQDNWSPSLLNPLKSLWRIRTTVE